jgi:hypothetical protein
MAPRRTRRWTPKAIPFGLLILLLGGWAFAAPLAGGYFGFGFYSDATWHLSAKEWELHLIPGLAAAAGGFMLMTPSRGWGRLGGLLAFLAGAWLIAGWAFYPVWSSGTIEPYGSDFMRGLRWLGQLLGPGGLILLFAGWLHGLFMSRKVVAEAPTSLLEQPAARVEEPPARSVEETPVTLPNSTTTE